ncbi:MAG TPA: hypothetical protein VK728_00845 [Candidatus Sulfotelmatobacter sp.]|nr:hypothetical protein [Candidatus Sulfotelmatobacter sp.]
MSALKVDILPSPHDIQQAPVLRAELERLVQLKVAEIMAERDALVFEPFFRSRQVAYELKRLQTVPEQEKFSVSYERYGCIDCKTHDVPHGGNGLCHNCRVKWFRRLTQIIGEGMKGERAQRARGTARAERLLPENAARDGVHRTWNQPYKMNTKEERALYARVAKRLGVQSRFVSSVARGGGNSEAVSKALKEELAQITSEPRP